MMELEKQVCKKELAERIKQLGVEQNALASWVKDFDFPNVKKGWRLWIDGEICGPGYDPSCFDASHERKYHPEIEIYSAFNVAELGELLSGIKNKDISFQWNCIWKYWQVFLTDENCNEEWETHADTEADARAKCLIYLLENGG